MVLFVNQPFATALCRGLLPYLFTDQRLELNERVYIYALDVYRHVTDYPIEWHQESFNHFIFDNLTDAKALPTGAILGFVDVKSVCKEARAIGDGELVYLVTNAHLFVAPFEMAPDEIDANKSILKMMNTEMFVPRVPSLRNEGKEFFCPVNSFTYCVCLCEYDFTLDLSPSLSRLLLDAEGGLKPITKITLWNGTSAKSFQVDDATRILFRQDKLDELKRCPRILPESDDRVGAMVHFSCHHMLYD